MFTSLGRSSGAQFETEEPLPETLPVASAISLSDDIHMLCRNMDTNGVRSYLIQRVKEYDMLDDKILDSLRLASDPAKLVLDMMQSLYELDWKEVPVDDFAAGCIFMLVKLMKLRASISSCVKEEAKKFADIWRGFLEKQSKYMKNFGFLQFLGSYKLVDSYDADELFSLFVTLFDDDDDVVYLPDKIPILCDALGLTRKIPGT